MVSYKLLVKFLCEEEYPFYPHKILSKVFTKVIDQGNKRISTQPHVFDTRIVTSCWQKELSVRAR